MLILPKITYCMVALLAICLVCASQPVYAEVITTGSERVDSFLQWLTSVTTAFSFVANFIPTPSRATRRRWMSILVNVLAGNWVHVKEAFSGKPSVGHDSEEHC